MSASFPRWDSDADNNSCVGGEMVFRLLAADDSLAVNWLVNGQQVGGDSTVLHYVFDSSGIFRVDAAMPGECDTLSAYVVVRPADSVTMQQFLCKGDTLFFENLAIVDSGSYSAVLQGAYGCDSIVLLNVTLVDIAQSSEIDTTCSKPPYFWNGRVLDSTGIYSDTLQGSNGCDSVARLDLTVLPSYEVRIDTTADCVAAFFSLTACLPQTIGVDEESTFTWSAVPVDPLLVGHEHDTVVQVKPQTLTCYKLSTDHSCPWNDSIMLAPIDNLHAQLKVVPDAVTIDHPVFDAYDMDEELHERLWLLNGVENSFRGNPLHGNMDLEKENTFVGLVVWRVPSCRDTAYASIRLCRETLWYPNVFTPDEDINNRFAIIGIGLVQEELDIFNRWGLLVYHTDHPEDGWDGTSHGIPCKQEAYVWRLKYRRVTMPDAYQIEVGTVTLLR